MRGGKVGRIRCVARMQPEGAFRPGFDGTTWEIDAADGSCVLAHVVHSRRRQ
jgi:hypothetical protein